MTLAPLEDTLPRYIARATDREVDTVRQLLATWQRTLPSNTRRSAYYDGTMPVPLPDNMPAEAFRRAKAVLGWPEKAVGELARRSVFDGFVTPGQDQDPFELVGILDANRFEHEFPQAILSAYKHSCAFVTTAAGDTAAGEPAVVVLARSAEWSAALWDRRRRALAGFLAVTAIDEHARPTGMDIYLPDVILTCRKRPSGAWVADRRRNPLGEVLAEPVTFDPQLDRPFGRSRISRAVMGITDGALRTILRTEVSSDFYSAPRMAALGVAEDAFAGGKWQAAIDRWFALTKDEDGDVPTVTQFPQMTMQPLLEQYRLFASMFAGETGLAVSSLGIVQDNPPSAESMYAAEKDLIVLARAANRVHDVAARNIGRRSVMLRDGLTEAPRELRQLRSNWLNPAFTSPVSSADALVKLATVFPWLGDTEVALEFAGFTQPEVTRLLADKRRAQGPQLIGDALARVGQATADPAERKAKFDALGVAIRAGVEPADAARRVGLGNLTLTGAVPVSLRQPERAAATFEER